MIALILTQRRNTAKNLAAHNALNPEQQKADGVQRIIRNHQMLNT